MLTETTSKPILGSGFSGIKSVALGAKNIAVAHPVITTAVAVWLGTTLYWVLKTKKLRKQVKSATA
ncbi:MAG: hypothetical protein GKR96_08960 [Gammaproteobacteria bacterium]|nr:hypothetical protein [Gammaproteobacteria bacterium]